LPVLDCGVNSLEDAHILLGLSPFFIALWVFLGLVPRSVWAELGVDVSMRHK